MKTSKKAILALVLILALLTSACAVTPIDVLNLAVGALEIALPLIPGVPPTLATMVDTYLGGVSQAIASASDILAGSGTDAQKAALIVQAFAGIAVPVVPAQYAALATAVEKVAQYVAQFLASTTSPISGTSAASNARTTVGSPTHAATASQRAKLATIKARALAVHSAVAR